MTRSSFDPARLQVRCPHLLVWGTDDTALLPETTRGLEDYAPDLTRRHHRGARITGCTTKNRKRWRRPF